MDILKKLSLLIIILIVNSCGKNKDAIIHQPSGLLDVKKFTSADLTSEKSKLLINLDMATGEIRELSDDNLKPTILIFSGEFCITCREENNELLDLFSADPNLLEKINLYTIFIRANQRKAQIIQRRWGITWETSYDQKNILFKQLCPSGQTPCTLVHTPSEGIIYNASGPFSKDAFINWTKAED